MGLDVTAYGNLVQLADFMYLGADDDDLPDGVVRLCVNENFPDRADQITDGCYEYEDRFGFPAGSYSGYSEWRKELAKLAGYEKDWKDVRSGDGAFSELIAFSDCSGVIGSTHSHKLARDFAAFQSQADAHDDKWFRERYSNFRKAFELASDEGAVEFH